MGTLITLFSPPLEQKILRPKACRQGREEGSSSVERVDRPPQGAESGLAGVTCTAYPKHWNGCCCLLCPTSLSPGAVPWASLWAGEEMKCVFSSSPLEPGGKKGHLRISGVGHRGIGCLLSFWKCFACSALSALSALIWLFSSYTSVDQGM